MLLLESVLVGKNNRIAAIEGAQVISICHGLRKTRGVTDCEYAADAQLHENGVIDRDLGRTVSVEFRRCLAQRGVVENQLASSPSRYPIDGWRVLLFGHTIGESKAFAG